MKGMACVNQCPDAVKSWSYTDYQCHPVERKYYRHVYAVCMNGLNLYCKTEWSTKC
ncbi:laterosporulin family class IId bacteriocin [Brevibacillus laterosporus]|uniref:laterosporulin family class IId bacteriocin n=2 Tax=Brevibacillus laterosporus TaxID=1465 RepID=UPI0011B087B4